MTRRAKTAPWMKKLRASAARPCRSCAPGARGAVMAAQPRTPHYHWVDGSQRRFRGASDGWWAVPYCNSAGSSAIWANSAVAPASASFSADVIAVKP